MDYYQNMQKIDKETKKSAVRTIFTKDILEFAKFFLPHHLRLKSPKFHDEIVKLISDETNSRVAIAAPRSHAKSTIVDLVYLLWVVVHKKAKYVLLISDTYTQATAFLDALKAELEGNDKLKAMYGDMTSKNWSGG